MGKVGLQKQEGLSASSLPHIHGLSASDNTSYNVIRVQYLVHTESGGGGAVLPILWERK